MISVHFISNIPIVNILMIKKIYYVFPINVIYREQNIKVWFSVTR